MSLPYPGSPLFREPQGLSRAPPPVFYSSGLRIGLLGHWAHLTGIMALPRSRQQQPPVIIAAIGGAPAHPCVRSGPPLCLQVPPCHPPRSVPRGRMSMACRPSPAAACAWVTAPAVAASTPTRARGMVATRPRLPPLPTHRALRGRCTLPAAGFARSSFVGRPTGGLLATAAAAAAAVAAAAAAAVSDAAGEGSASTPHPLSPAPHSFRTLVTMGLPIPTIPPLVFQAAVVNGALIAAASASRQRALTPAGVRHAAALGLLLWSAMGAAGWGLCVAFLVGGTALTRVGRAAKEAAGIAEGRGGRRGPENVWGAGAAGALCAVGMLVVGGAGGARGGGWVLQVRLGRGVLRGVWGAAG